MNENIARTITRLSRKCQVCVGNVMSPYHLTAAELPFFMTIQHMEGLTQEALTSIVCVDKSATTRVIKSLEEKGYLLKIQDEADRRQNRIYPTSLAKELGPAVKAELSRFNEQLTRDIDPEMLSIFYKNLIRMENNLNSVQSEKSKSDINGNNRKTKETK